VRGFTEQIRPLLRLAHRLPGAAFERGTGLRGELLGVLPAPDKALFDTFPTTPSLPGARAGAYDNGIDYKGILMILLWHGHNNLQRLLLIGNNNLCL